MNLIIGMLLGMTAQFLTFVQLQGRWKFEWMKEKYFKTKDEYDDDLKHKFKTGDIILFHALDNINPIFIGTYFGHIGIVYIHNGEPYLFEAAATKNMYLIYQTIVLVFNKLRGFSFTINIQIN